MDGRSDLFFWILLQRIPGIGPSRYHQLLKRFGSPRQVFSATAQALKELGLAAKSIASIVRTRQNPDDSLVAQCQLDLLWLENTQACVLTFASDAYPPQLREIATPPPLLYVLGDASILKKPQLAIVGARSASTNGCRAAYDFAFELARNDMVITSGLALGIDAACHEGALAADGYTLAVLGTGLDQLYPARHKHLAERIAVQGAIVSEFALGTGPRREHFPRRNRLISGLSIGVLVVEAARQSGSLITAHYALEQNREVFAIPGSIHNPLSRGCHSLIRQGAKLVESVADIYEEIGAMGQIWQQVESDEKAPDTSSKLSVEELKLLDCIGYEPTPVDLIIARTALPAGVVSAMLVGLELDGQVETSQGGYQRLAVRR
jgi:DNA processing protein